MKQFISKYLYNLISEQIFINIIQVIIVYFLTHTNYIQMIIQLRTKQNLNNKDKDPCTSHPTMFITHICTSPFCQNYRELCQRCLRTQPAEHRKFHIPKQQAYQKCIQSLDELFKGLKGLRIKIIQQMDTNLNSYQGLFEVESRLSQIKDLINQKIDAYKNQLRKIYQKQIKQKLHQLFQIVEKSHQFLEDERNKLTKSKNLRPFYVNDLHHQLKFYESYFDEILEKNVRKFKAGFDHDKILKLMVNFEQNLQQIFKIQKDVNSEHKFHYFYGDKLNLNRLTQSVAGQLQYHDINIEKQQDKWQGVIQSVYYSQRSCYYLVGQGNKQSNKIQKYFKGQLKPMGKLQTKRKNFSICLLDHEIYIVGGQNSKEGCLIKCQKYVPSENKVYIINSLNHRSSRHSLVTFKDKYILKFGGSNQPQKIYKKQGNKRIDNMAIFNSPSQPQSVCQVYSTQTEQWKIIDMPRPVNFGYFPSIFKPQNEGIFILSGYTPLLERSTKQKFALDIQSDEKEVKQIRIKISQNDFSSKYQILEHKMYEKQRILIFAKEYNSQNHIELRTINRQQ